MMELNLRKIRKDKGLTQSQLASAVGATKRQIGAWERDENDIPMDYASAIADFLGCTIDDIAGREIRYSVIELPDDNGLVSSERELIDCYRRMDDADKSTFLDMARTLALAGDVKKKDARGVASGDVEVVS